MGLHQIIFIAKGAFSYVPVLMMTSTFSYKGLQPCTVQCKVFFDGFHKISMEPITLGVQWT